MDPVETVGRRIAQIGLDESAARDVHETIVSTQAPTKGPAAAERVEIPVSESTKTFRELPRISVDLRLPDDAPPPAASDVKVERDLEVVAILGQGGMGRVLLARQHSLDREVAIKTLHEGASAKDRAALLSEGAITGHLEHPTIVPVHALGVDENGSPVLVMKRIEGVEWSALLRDPKHPGWGSDARERLDAHLDILMQISNAVHFAHSRAIVHRDIKPANVFVGRFGEVYLGDWGIAVRVDREWTPEPLCGTPAYMAPEMIVGDPVDARTDVYLLGATLHQILTGKSRNAGLSTRAALYGAVSAPPFPYPTGVPQELADLANRATAPDRADRPASALEFRQAIAAYLEHKTSVALARLALGRLDTLRTLVADAAQLAQATRQHEIDVRSAEIRFALEQALHQWPENAAAARGMTELDAVVAAREARTAELERLARELDPNTARWPRAMLLGALALMGVGLGVSAFVWDPRSVTALVLLYHSFAPLGVLALMALVLRSQMLRTAFNRRVLLGCATLLLGIAVSRILGVIARETVATVLMHDSLLAAAVCGVCAALVFRWLAWTVFIMLAAATVCALVPEQALRWFSLASSFAFVLNTGFAVRNARMESARS